MKTFRRSANVVLTLTVATLFAGCSGGSRNAVPSSTDATVADARKSNLSKDALIYAADYYGTVYVYKTDGKLVQTLDFGLVLVPNMCSDSSGNVWIITVDSTSYASKLTEYAHAGTTPIATIDDGSEYAISCAVDPATGNLAVGNGSNVAVFKHAKGTPKYYASHKTNSFFSASYDGDGNLFLAGDMYTSIVEAAWLRKGAQFTTNFKTRPLIAPFYGVAWDGRYIVLGEREQLERYSLEHRTGVEAGALSLGTCCVNHFAIHGRLLVTTNKSDNEVQLFKYPQGGSPTLTIPNVANAYAVTISVVPFDTRAQSKSDR